MASVDRIGNKNGLKDSSIFHKDEPPQHRGQALCFPARIRKRRFAMKNVLSRKIQPKARELGLPHVTWRLLRKWGLDPPDCQSPVNAVQERLGHSRPDMVLIHYAR